MGTTRPSQVLDPASLPPGTEVGAWRVVSWCGRGTYGTVYRVERRGQEGQGTYALKLALHSRDERFKREEELLSRVNHPNVPRLEGHGVWEHPSGGFPYLVMQWVAGVPLYEWAAQRNPTSRQVLRLLAQVARALEATAAAGGMHRDVKGDNVLVRLADGHAFLTDFGAGFYRGAATLTIQPLPPGTPGYRSPEAWAFQRLFAFHPLEHYRGSLCDDLFALGVTGYRLVTDEYPPPTEPEQDGAEVWVRRGPGPRPPRELNARVCTELDALILRLLSQPESRFKGNARHAAEALEHAADTAGPEADVPLFEWEALPRSAWPPEDQRLAELHGHRLRRRDRAAVQRAVQRDAEAREQERARARSTPQPRLVHADEKVLRWLPWMVPVIGILVFVLGTRGPSEYEQLPEAPQVAQAEKPDAGTPDGGTSLAEETLAAVSVEPATPESWDGVAVPMPKGLLPGQRKPPCNLQGEVEIRGACWFAVLGAKPPCELNVTANLYEYDGSCYLPSYPPRRRPTSEPP